MASNGEHPDPRLIATLDDLARHLVVPDASSVSIGLRARLGDQRVRSSGARMHRARTKALAAVAVVLLIVAVVLTASPATRDAVADWFGLDGVEIEHRDGPARVPAGSRLSLGEPVGLDEARRHVDFEIAVPPRDRFGAPDGVFLGDVPAGGRVTLAYAPRDGLPAAGTTGVGLLLSEFRADIPDAVIRKTLGAGSTAEQVTVDDARGYWISGAPHVVSLADEHGRFFTDRARLAGDTLLWQRGPVTYRLESALTRDEAIRIAEALPTN